MQRREFIMLFGGAVAAWPLAARTRQAKKVYRVGFLWDGPDVFPDALEAFRQGLRDLGYVEGQTIAMEYRWVDGKPERMRELAQQADGYLRQTEAQRQGVIVRAKYPESSDASHTVTDAGR
jgi:putative ABC transport system substrate-binding protein